MRRYAGDRPSHVLVLAGPDPVSLPRRFGRAGWRRGSPVVSVTRATVIGAEGVDPAGAPGWLEAAAGTRAEATVEAALAVLNRAVHAHRAAAADPYVAEVGPRDALVTRVGYGSGEQVAEGDWTAARELPAPPQPRAPRGLLLGPQERLAALLAGRDAVLACETLALRARLDLEQGREREAAAQLAAALECGLAELAAWRELPGMGARLDELERHRPAAAAAAIAAGGGGLEPAELAAVQAILARLEAALRARVAALRL